MTNHEGNPLDMFAVVPTAVESTPRGISEEFTVIATTETAMDRATQFMEGVGARECTGKSPMKKAVTKATAMPGIQGWKATWNPTGPENSPLRSALKGVDQEVNLN